MLIFFRRITCTWVSFLNKEVRCHGRCHTVSDIHLIWQRCPSLEWNQPEDQAKTLQKAVETSFEATEEFLIQVKNNAQVEKESEKNPLSYDPRICTSLTKAIVLVLLVHKCPKMNFACREHKRNITSKYILFFWSICYCNTLQNVNNFAKGKHSPDTNINAILFA